MIKHIRRQLRLANEIYQQNLRLKHPNSIAHLHKCLLLIVKLILHVPKNLLQNILHRNHSTRPTKFIHHNRQMVVIRPHLLQRIVNRLVLRNKIWCLHKLLPRKIRTRVQMRNQTLNTQHPHYRIHRLVVHRHPRKPCLTDHAEQLVKIDILRNRCHIHPRTHNLLHLNGPHIHNPLQNLLLLLRIVLVGCHINRPRQLLGC